MNYQTPSTNNQIITNFPMTKILNEQRSLSWSFGHWNIAIYLACLREAASAKAGIWNLVIGI